MTRRQIYSPLSREKRNKKNLSQTRQTAESTGNLETVKQLISIRVDPISANASTIHHPSSRSEKKKNVLISSNRECERDRLVGIGRTRENVLQDFPQARAATDLFARCVAAVVSLDAVTTRLVISL